VIEEALLSLRRNTPLYLASMLGGATQHIVDAIEGRAMPDTFCPPTSVHDSYNRPPVDELDSSTLADRRVDRREVWAELARGRAQIFEANRLTRSENDELTRTPVLERVIQLVLTGLSRLGPAQRA
jgi:hypothetical protein